ncbi:MAG TPA: acyl-CoA dehydrogenase [Streptosporangiaceae bacterium]|nr:acyl-CoA dehydrogenase [Streptosporangiaceae bacterium]
MAIALTPEQLALAESVAQWAKRANTIPAVRDLETLGGRSGQEPWSAANWHGLTEAGVFTITVPESEGGAGGSVVDVAVVTEALALTLAPGPVLPTLIAGLVLPAGHALLEQLGAGTASVAVPLRSGGLIAVESPGGGLTVTGTASLVLGAGDTTHLLLAAESDAGETWFVLESSGPGVRIAPRAPVDFSRALGDVTLDGLRVPPVQVLDLRPGLVSDLAATLAAADASGIAAWCVTTASDYAKTRMQFGRPIGSFQAMKHLCATMLGRSELVTALAWDAALAASHASDELPLASAAAAALALDAAVDNAKDCVQVLGGIGFTWEHDAHLYLRRALALRQLLGGSAIWRARAAELALDGSRRHRAGQEESGRAADVRKAAALVAKATSAVPPERVRKGLAEVGYVAPAWPKPYGLGVTPAEVRIIDEELAAVGITRPDLAIGNWAIPAIAQHGTQEQLERFAEPTLRGDITWCQLFSEPEAGSDLASLRTRAVKADGGWSITGQKVWTSLAHQADWAICLARTDPDVPKHKGITYFLVPMKGPGIEIRPLREMTGRQMFNQVFLDEVFVPDDCVVGQPGDGWKIARTTLATERVAMVRGGGLSAELEQLLTTVAKGANLTMLDAVGARLAEGLALSAIDDRLADAHRPDSLAAVKKLLGVSHRQAIAETALVLSGERGAAEDGHAAAAVQEFLLTRCLSIAGGTTQVLLTLVAERVLGLPREEGR